MSTGVPSGRTPASASMVSLGTRMHPGLVQIAGVGVVEAVLALPPAEGREEEEPEQVAPAGVRDPRLERCGARRPSRGRANFRLRLNDGREAAHELSAQPREDQMKKHPSHAK